VKKAGLIFLFVCVGFSVLSAQEPAWVKRPASVYPDSLFVSAIGTAKERAQAETAALGLLTASFKQSITNTITMRESETRSGNRTSSTSENSLAIEATSSLVLMGAQIKETYNDRQGWYAIAVMERTRCAPLYRAELEKKISEARSLIDISGGVTFETISRCRQAQAALAEADVAALVLAMLGGANRQAEVTGMAETVRNTLDQAKSIPVDVRVSGDVNNRIRNAFTTSFTNEGFKTGNRNSRYALEVTVSIAPATQNRYYNTRYTVDALLKDTQTGADLFTFNITNREAHPGSQDEANNRAVIGAERKVSEDFPEVLQDYLNAN
jgi:hypothetical protein